MTRLLLALVVRLNPYRDNGLALKLYALAQHYDTRPFPAGMTLARWCAERGFEETP